MKGDRRVVNQKRITFTKKKSSLFHFLRALIVFLSLTFSTSFVIGQTASIEAGEQKSSLCVACHGPKGISPNSLWPNLAGQKQEYLFLQLKDYKTGERKNELMNSLTQSLNEEDMRDLSAYYSSLKP